MNGSTGAGGGTGSGSQVPHQGQQRYGYDGGSDAGYDHEYPGPAARYDQRYGGRYEEQREPAYGPGPISGAGADPGHPGGYPAGAGGGTAGRGVRQPLPPAGAARPAVPRTRTARLRIARADPWSVMKISFVLSAALGICTIVAVAMLWLVLDGLGVFSTVGATLTDATGAGGGGFDLTSFLSLPRVLLFTTVVAVIDVVLLTALATLVSFLYNMSTGFVGGVELTLAEDQ